MYAFIPIKSTLMPHGLEVLVAAGYERGHQVLNHISVGDELQKLATISRLPIQLKVHLLDATGRDKTTSALVLAKYKILPQEERLVQNAIGTQDVEFHLEREFLPSNRLIIRSNLQRVSSLVNKDNLHRMLSGHGERYRISAPLKKKKV